MINMEVWEKAKQIPIMRLEDLVGLYFSGGLRDELDELDSIKKSFHNNNRMQMSVSTYADVQEIGIILNQCMVSMDFRMLAEAYMDTIEWTCRYATLRYYTVGVPNFENFVNVPISLSEDEFLQFMRISGYDMRLRVLAKYLKWKSDIRFDNTVLDIEHDVYGKELEYIQDEAAIKELWDGYVKLVNEISIDLSGLYYVTKYFSLNDDNPYAPVWNMLYGKYGGSSDLTAESKEWLNRTMPRKLGSLFNRAAGDRE